MPKKTAPKPAKKAATPAGSTPAKMGKPIGEGPLKPLAEQMGGMGKLAEAMGVHFRSVTKWNIGERVPEAPARRMLALLASQHGLPPPFPL